MADLESLIRYRKHQVDEKRRFLAKLYEQSESMVRTKKEMEEKLKSETLFAHEQKTAEAYSDLGTFSIGIKRQIKGFEESIVEMDVRIAAAQEDMRQAFAELKKIEITQRRRKKRQDAAQKYKEDQELDEIGLETYRRRLEEAED